MKIKSFFNLLLVLSLAIPTQAQVTNPAPSDLNKDIEVYGLWLSNIEKNINLFLNEYQNAFPANEIDSERLAEKINSDLSNETDSNELLNEIASAQDRHLPKEGIEDLKEDITKAPYRQKARNIVRAAFQNNSPNQIDLLVTYLLMRFLKEPERRQGIWFLLETFRDEKLGETQRMEIDRNDSYWYNATVALGYTLVADLVLVAMLPKVRNSSAFNKLLNQLRRMFPQIFERSASKTKNLLALPKPEDVSAPYTKVFEGPTKNLPSPYVIINGKLQRTHVVGAAARRIEPIRTRNSQVRIEDAVKKSKITETLKESFAQKLLLATPGQRIRHIMWFTSSVALGGVSRYVGHQNGILWMDQNQVLPQEEMDRYLAQTAVIKLQCAVTDLKNKVAHRNYAILPENTYGEDAQDLNALFNQYALISVMSPTLMPKQKIRSEQIFSNGKVNLAYDEELGQFAFQREFENSTEVDSWSCAHWPGRNSKQLESSLAEAAIDLDEARNSILSGKLKKRWELNLSSGALKAVDEKEINLNQIDWLNLNAELSKYEPVVIELARTQANKLLNLNSEKFNSDLAELVSDLKTQSVYGNLPLLLALQMQIEQLGLTGSVMTPKKLMIGEQ